ncbi:MAG: GNAT family N-acetyltransferase [Sneathiella sp.]|nr:GNAT family N-acetyltransferase [Sneathiella sp.]
MRWKFGAPLTLETENYILQSLEPAHIPGEMVAWFADDETMRYMNDPMNLDISQLSQFFSGYKNNHRIALLIYKRTTKKPIGIFRIYLDLRNERAVTSVMIGDKNFWGASVVLEIRERIIQFLFTTFRIEKICGNVRARNLPALFNYSRQHFKKEGIQVRQIRNREGKFDDVVEFALFKEDWLKQKRTEHAAKQNELKV